MRLRARFEINGMLIAGPEARSWDQSTVDGAYILRFPPIAVDQVQAVAEALGTPNSLVAVRIDVEGLPTVEEIQTRLAAVERVIQGNLSHADAQQLIAESQAGAHSGEPA